DDRARTVRAAHPVRAGDARRVHRQGHVRADGDRRQPHHRGDLLRRLRAGRGGGHDGRGLLRLDLVFHGLSHRAQGVHRRGDRGDRLDPRRHARRPDPRPARKFRHADPRHRQRVEGRVLVLGADPGAGVQADRPARPVRAGAHVMPGPGQRPDELRSGEPRPDEPRPSVWGGLTRYLDTPAKRTTALAAILAFMVAAPFLFGPYATVILTNALLYTILALGLNVVVGYAGLLDLGYAAFFAVGAYTVGILTTDFHWNFWATIPVAILAAVVAGVIIGGPTLRLRSDYLAIVTLGFGEIVRISARNLEITGAASGISGIEQPWLFGWHIATQTDFYFVFLVLVVIAVVCSARLANSRLGRAWLYVRHDEDAAEAMGIDRVRVKLAAYVIGAIYGSIGGVFFAVNLTAISPQSFSFQQSTLFLMAVILGGMGKIPGVILGAFIVVLAPELLRDLGSFRLLIFAVGLLLIMLFRPSGIWPARRGGR